MGVVCATGRPRVKRVSTTCQPQFGTSTMRGQGLERRQGPDS